jgi:hypothetical protein
LSRRLLIIAKKTKTMLRKGINNRRVASIRLDDSDSDGDSCGTSRKRRNNRRRSVAIHLEDSASNGNNSDCSRNLIID